MSDEKAPEPWHQTKLRTTLMEVDIDEVNHIHGSLSKLNGTGWGQFINLRDKLLKADKELRTPPA